MKSRSPIYPQLICIVMLIWAILGDNPYGYYVLLRWICSATLAYLAWRAHLLNRAGLTWILAVGAMIYNPVFRVHAARGLWSIINVATMVVLIVSVRLLRVRQPDSSPHL